MTVAWVIILWILISLCFFTALAYAARRPLPEPDSDPQELSNLQKIVAETLSSPLLASAGYRTFHGLVLEDGVKIHHVVIGPPGVFVIESRGCACPNAGEPKQGNSHVGYDGSTLQFPWGKDDDAVGQVLRNAKGLERLIAPHAPRDLRFESLVVVPGCCVEALSIFPVKIINPSFLIDFLCNEPRLYTPDQLLPMFQFLEARSGLTGCAESVNTHRAAS